MWPECKLSLYKKHKYTSVSPLRPITHIRNSHLIFLMKLIGEPRSNWEWGREWLFRLWAVTSPAPPNTYFPFTVFTFHHQPHNTMMYGTIIPPSKVSHFLAQVHVGVFVWGSAPSEWCLEASESSLSDHYASGCFPSTASLWQHLFLMNTVFRCFLSLSKQGSGARTRCPSVHFFKSNF